jgi:hypothetical protein
VVAADRQADAAHVLMVGGDDVPEGDLVTGGSGRERVGLLPSRYPRDRFHAP